MTTPNGRFELMLTLLFVLAGGLISVRALSLHIGSLAEPRPGFFPFIAGTGLIMLGLIQSYRTLKKRTLGTERITPGTGWKAAVLTSTLTIYALVLEWIGFIVSTSLLCLVVMLITHRPRWYVLVPIVIGVSVITHGLFNDLLGVSLPKGTIYSD